jgi:hypothetical protein
VGPAARGIFWRVETSPENAPDHAVVAQGDMHLLREVQTVLKRSGIEARMVSPPSGCGTGG